MRRLKKRLSLTAVGLLSVVTSCGLTQAVDTDLAFDDGRSEVFSLAGMSEAPSWAYGGGGGSGPRVAGYATDGIPTRDFPPAMRRWMDPHKAPVGHLAPELSFSWLSVEATSQADPYASPTTLPIFEKDFSTLHVFPAVGFHVSTVAALDKAKQQAFWDILCEKAQSSFHPLQTKTASPPLAGVDRALGVEGPIPASLFEHMRKHPEKWQWLTAIELAFGQRDPAAQEDMALEVLAQFPGIKYFNLSYSNFRASEMSGLLLALKERYPATGRARDGERKDTEEASVPFVIDISHNPLGDGVSEALCAFLAETQLCKRIEAGYCDLTDASAEAIKKALWRHDDTPKEYRALILALAGNRFSASGVDQLTNERNLVAHFLEMPNSIEAYKADYDFWTFLKERYKPDTRELRLEEGKGALRYSDMMALGDFVYYMNVDALTLEGLAIPTEDGPPLAPLERAFRKGRLKNLSLIQVGLTEEEALKTIEVSLNTRWQRVLEHLDVSGNHIKPAGVASGSSPLRNIIEGGAPGLTYLGLADCLLGAYGVHLAFSFEREAAAKRDQAPVIDLRGNMLPDDLFQDRYIQLLDRLNQAPTAIIAGNPVSLKLNKPYKGWQEVLIQGATPAAGAWKLAVLGADDVRPGLQQRIQDLWKDVFHTYKRYQPNIKPAEALEAWKATDTMKHLRGIVADHSPTGGEEWGGLDYVNDLLLRVLREGAGVKTVQVMMPLGSERLNQLLANMPRNIKEVWIKPPILSPEEAEAEEKKNAEKAEKREAQKEEPASRTVEEQPAEAPRATTLNAPEGEAEGGGFASVSVLEPNDANVLRVFAGLPRLKKGQKRTASALLTKLESSKLTEKEDGWLNQVKAKM